MAKLEPGPNFSDSDDWPTHPLGVDAPRHRLGEDSRHLSSQSQD
ncbi:hypothetical protein [Nocardia sp. NPDC019302]